MSKYYFYIFLKSLKLELVNIQLVSSVNKIGLDFPLTVIDKLFIQRRKSRGPKIYRCGTPCFTRHQFENVLQVMPLYTRRLESYGSLHYEHPLITAYT